MSRGQPGEEAFLQAVAAFESAPFDPHGWEVGIDLFARLAGGWAGQIVGIVPGSGLQFDLAPGVSTDILAEFERLGGDLPGINPRARALFAAPMTVFNDDEIVDARERAASPFYQQFYNRLGADHAVLARLPDVEGIGTVVAALRDKQQGVAGAAEHDWVARLLPHIATATRLAMRIGQRDLRTRITSFDEARLAAIVCDGQGRILATSAPAQIHLARGNPLTQRDGRLDAIGARNNGRLHDSIAQAGVRLAAGEPLPRTSTFALPTHDGAAMRVDVSPIHEASSFGIRGGRCVVFLCGSACAPDACDRLRDVFGLSRAEAQVALALLDGIPPQDIAEARAASVDTVRAQTRALYAKLGVTKATRLASVVGHFAR